MPKQNEVLSIEQAFLQHIEPGTFNFDTWEETLREAIVHHISHEEFGDNPTHFKANQAYVLFRLYRFFLAVKPHFRD